MVVIQAVPAGCRKSPTCRMNVIMKTPWNALWSRKAGEDCAVTVTWLGGIWMKSPTERSARNGQLKARTFCSIQVGWPIRSLKSMKVGLDGSVPSNTTMVFSLMTISTP